MKPIPFFKLAEQNQKDARQLFEKYANEAISLLDEIPAENEYIIARAVADTRPIENILTKIINGELKQNYFKAEQLQQIKYQLLPILESSDYIIGAAILSNQGFEAKIRINSNDNKLANAKVDHTISIAEFINPDSLMAFAQTHPIEDAAQTMKELNKFPQTASVLSMMKNVGIDMEKDILSNSARESIFYVNLDPTGEGGTPDLRFVAPVPDMKKMTSLLPRLKELCGQTGIFVKPVEDKFNLVRLSYFMFPQYGVYASLFDNFLVLASGQKNLIKEINFLQSVKSQKAQSETVEKNLQKYWRISFDDFNLQLQRFLQSPLMADKGIPPVSNLTLLDNLAHLKILTRLKPDRIEFSIILPIKKSE
jgi:ribosomal protein S8